MMPKSKVRKKTPKMTDTVEAPVVVKSRKRAAETGPRTFKPVQLVAGVDGNTVKVYLATKDEVAAARMLRTTMRTDDTVEIYTVTIS